MTHQVTLTIIAAVKGDHVQQLAQLLETMGSDAANNPLIPYRQAIRRPLCASVATR